MSLTVACRFRGEIIEKDYIYAPACISLKQIYRNVNVIIETDLINFFENILLVKKPIFTHIGGVKELVDRKIISKAALVFFYFRDKEVEESFEPINRFKIPVSIKEDLPFDSFTNRDSVFEIPDVREMCREVERRGAQKEASSFYF